jgi:uncharacterized protein DUF222/HNH endonuclease
MTGTVDSSDRGHPIGVGLSRIVDELKTLRDAPAWSMTAAQTRAALTELSRLEAGLAELQLRVAGHARTVQVEAESGATSTATWWAHATKQTRPVAHRKTKLAAALGTGVFEPVRVALAEGRMLADQAQVITAAVEALPGDLDPDLRAEAVATLVGHAADFDAKALRVLGRGILAAVAPEVGEAHEARVLAAEERDAAAAASFRMVEDGHGRCHGRFTIPALQGAMLRKQLLAIAAPKHRAAADGKAPEPGRPSAHRLGEAFLEYVETYPTDRLPKTGGVNATVVVTMPLETLIGGLKAAGVDTGHRVSPGLARRLACEAGIIPAVLGSKSQVLDLGRKVRFHTEPQRIAIALEQGGCTAEGCDWPPGMCHAHHDQPWSKGGPTSVRNGRLLCPRHHARAHDPTYQMAKLPGGKVRFHRRT